MQILNTRSWVLYVAVSMGVLGAVGCLDHHESSDEVQARQQEAILQEGTSQIGMPSIKNFREKKIAKDIYELRDQDGLVTYTYLWSQTQGRLIHLCDSIGYGLPAATQFTSPEKPLHIAQGVGFAVPQADPNGLFSPSAAEGTWVMCQDPNGMKTAPVYLEERIIVSPFRLDPIGDKPTAKSAQLPSRQPTAPAVGDRSAARSAAGSAAGSDKSP